MSLLRKSLSTLILSFFLVNSTFAQNASIKEELIAIPTYPFSDPSPVTTLITKPGIYPYHKFEGYSHKSETKNWKVVTLENDYIKVFILPEVGGKVWGAIEKSTGKDFIYKNEVMKFRNIAMRGPWTSGGIEFNFGLIGHTPATATPVDYATSTNVDGSVSCTVGMMDLPSRTHWRVKITLHPDKAYFTTNATWYNPTSLTHPYYNWMTGAAKATDDLTFYIPGDIAIHHSGEPREWPIGNDGKELWRYKENNFGDNKSYHVVSKYHNFFGGYWQDEKIGFGHFGRQETMPGQKLWLWSLARDGGIWEDLLTDDNGQYIEFQAGRLLNQYFNDEYNNPITEMAFGPHLTDQWEEAWFPVKGTKGITAVTEKVAINITNEYNNRTLYINALTSINETLAIFIDGRLIKETPLSLKPMELAIEQVSDPGSITVIIGSEEIYSDRQEKEKVLKRPIANKTKVELKPEQLLYAQGSELVKRRNYISAKANLEACLDLNPTFLDAHNLMASIYYRNGEYDSALYHANFILQFDTYDFDANYTAGLSYKAKEDYYNAMDAFGLASRSMEYRSAAYTEIAQLELSERNIDKTIKDANYALEFNVKNVSALQSLIISHRLNKSETEHSESVKRLLSADPLNHFARFEKYLYSKNPEDLNDFKSKITNEFPYQTHLEIASIYLNARLFTDAIAVLEQSPNHLLVDLWLAYCNEKISEPYETYLTKAIDSSPEFVFPYRMESMMVLEWANNKSDSWKLDYLLGLNYWSKDKMLEASNMFISCDNKPDIASFYVTRSFLLEKVNNTDPLSDLEKALALGNNHWRYHHAIIKYYEERGLNKQLKHAEKAAKIFPDNYVIGLDYAQALVNNGVYDKSLKVLETIKVLPSEGSFSGRQIYGRASLLRAIELYQKGSYKEAQSKLSLSYLYPENMGSGKPYNPDERLLDYFMALIAIKSGNDPDSYFKKIVDYKEENVTIKYSIFNLLALKALKKEDELTEALSTIRSMESEESDWVITQWESKISGIELVSLMRKN